jgi:secreted Zn-dependent insulinase-like peptidase
MHTSHSQVRAALVAFHTRHYSSNLMSLVINGKEPLDTLQAWALSAFGATPNLDVDRPTAPSDQPPLPPSRLPMFVRVRPLEQCRQLVLGWYTSAPLPRDPTLMTWHSSSDGIPPPHPTGPHPDDVAPLMAWP